MKTCSFRDILKASWLKQYNEIELLSIDRDEDVQRLLHELGFDCDYPLSYFPANHRDLSGKIAIGFMVSGEVQINRKHLTSVFADLTDVLISSSYTDPSLTRELADLSGLSRNYAAYHECEVEEYNVGNYEIPDNQLEDDWEDVAKQIKQLEDIRDAIRGCQYNSSGALKTSQEYKEWAAQQKGN